MALRCFYVVLAFSMLIAGGCRSRANYQPACCPPTAVGVAPAPCAPVPVPPGAVLVPR